MAADQAAADQAGPDEPVGTQRGGAGPSTPDTAQQDEPDTDPSADSVDRGQERFKRAETGV
jgi:hypothetical protein